jgi:protein required for attachment to host cells
MQTQMDTTWILISDASRARLFATEGQGKPLQLVQEFEHPESRAANQDLVTDRPGRVQQSAGGGPGSPGGGSRSAMEPQTTPKEVEHDLFARELAGALYKGATGNAYAHLVLAAPPQFLGMLREVIDEPVRKKVSASLDKDYTRLDLRELTERVQGSLTPSA